MCSFDDLPIEVVEKIFGHFSHEQLFRLSYINNLGPHIARIICTSLIFENCTTKQPGLYISRKGFVVVQSSGFNNALDLIESIFLKEIKFDNPFHAIELMKQRPQYFKNTKIHLDLTKISSLNPKLFEFIGEYEKTPFPVDSLSIYRASDIDKYLSAYLTIHVTTFEANTIHAGDIRKISKFWFPNLQSLKLLNELTAGQIAQLPRNLINLSCVLVPKGPNDIKALPSDLIELTLLYKLKQRHHVSSLSHLANLRVLKLTSFHKKSYVEWQLPLNLEILHLEYSNFFHGRLDKMCPKLKELKIGINHKNKESNNKYGPLMNLPNNLKILEIPSTCLEFEDDIPFRNLLRTVPNILTKLTLPKNLKKLTIKEPPKRGKISIIDFNINQLLCLEELNINSVSKLKLIGAIPRGIIRLNLIKINKFDCNELIHLEKLESVTLENISCLMNQGFSYLLPESLRELSIINCGICHVFINSPSINYLNLRGNAFYVINKDTFNIPSNVYYLNLSDCHIKDISYKLPENLDYLDLQNNQIRFLVDIPKYLDTLLLDNNKIGEYGYPPIVFPSGLKILGLSRNVITTDTMKNLEFSYCLSLITLMMSFNKLDKVYTDTIPVSVRTLYLNNNNISSIIGDFKCHKLGKLVLSENKLNKYFHNFKGGLFGNDICLVDVDQNGLVESDFRRLSIELSKKPNFVKLKVEPDLISNGIGSSDGRPRKIRRLT